MAWNEQGDNDKQNQDKDPWSGRDAKKRPQDLDEALKQVQKKFKEFMSGRTGNGGSGEGTKQNISKKGGFFGFSLVVVVLLFIWVVSGIYIVQPPERAVVLTFGRYQTTTGPGLHWLPQFIQSEYRIDIQKLYSYTYPENEPALMLTKDQNIVAVAVTVQFRIDKPKDYLFNVVNPVNSLQQATASALRQVAGQMTLDDVLTTGRETLRSEVQNQLNEILTRYRTGISISNVLLQTAQAPDDVKDAFDDAVKAQEDEKRFVNQAQAYAMKVEPIADGQAKRILETANAYKQKVVLQAKGDVAPFLAILPEYQKSPEVMRTRLYIDAIQTVLQNTTKLLVDTNGSNLLYLPIDKIFNPTSSNSGSAANDGSVVKIPQSPVDMQSSTSKTNSAYLSRPSRSSAPGYSDGGINQ